MKCVICKREINNNDDYLKVELYLKGKLFGTDYAHQRCHINSQQINGKLNFLLNGLIKTSVDNGLINKPEVIIQ